MQRIERINLSKIQTCNQLWDDMPITDQGRLCQQCNKDIIDFRKMTPREIAERHAYAEENVCGIYTKQQLEYNPITKPSGCSKYKSLFVALASLVSQGDIEAQQQEPFKIEKVVVEPNNSKLVENNAMVQDTAALPLYILKGNLKESSTGENLIGCNVLVQGTECGTATDTDGNYVLDLSPIIANQESLEIIYSYVGFVSEHRQIRLDTFSASDSLEMNISLEGGQVISFGVVRHPWYKRLWFRITKPFR